MGHHNDSRRKRWKLMQEVWIVSPFWVGFDLTHSSRQGMTVQYRGGKQPRRALVLGFCPNPQMVEICYPDTEKKEAVWLPSVFDSEDEANARLEVLCSELLSKLVENGVC